jgi:hypothetical protein
MRPRLGRILRTNEGPKGTVAYMSPEQAEGKLPIAPISSGRPFYEMTTGPALPRRQHRLHLSAILRDAPGRWPRSGRIFPPESRHPALSAKIPNAGIKPPDLRNELRRCGRRIAHAPSGSGRLPRGAGAAGPEPKRIVVLPREFGAGDDAFLPPGSPRRSPAVSRGERIRVAFAPPLSSTTGLEDLRQVGADLRVDFVLEGNVRWPARARPAACHAQLIRATDDYTCGPIATTGPTTSSTCSPRSRSGW